MLTYSYGWVGNFVVRRQLNARVHAAVLSFRKAVLVVSSCAFFLRRPSYSLPRATVAEGGADRLCVRFTCFSSCGRAHGVLSSDGSVEGVALFPNSVSACGRTASGYAHER